MVGSSAVVVGPGMDILARFSLQRERNGMRNIKAKLCDRIVKRWQLKAGDRQFVLQQLVILYLLYLHQANKNISVSNLYRIPK